MSSVISPSMSSSAFEVPSMLTSLPAATKRPSLLVVDDDPMFRLAVAAAGRRAGLYVMTHDAAADLALMPHDGDVDVAIVDYDLGGWTGAQLAVLFRETAVLMVSSSLHMARASKPWPSSVGAFIAKSRGVGRIVAAAVELSEKRHLHGV